MVYGLIPPLVPLNRNSTRQESLLLQPMKRNDPLHSRQGVKKDLRCLTVFPNIYYIYIGIYYLIITKKEMRHEVNVPNAKAYLPFAYLRCLTFFSNIVFYCSSAPFDAHLFGSPWKCNYSRFI